MKSVSALVNLSQPTIARIFDQVGYSAKALPRALSLDEFRRNNGAKKICLSIENNAPPANMQFAGGAS